MPRPPVEARVIAGAAARRRREFATDRSCAREALRRLGAPATPLPPDSARTGSGTIREVLAR
jgi:4'-phosphopantetheinyl transferase EntD